MNDIVVARIVGAKIQLQCPFGLKEVAKGIQGKKPGKTSNGKFCWEYNADILTARQIIDAFGEGIDGDAAFNELADISATVGIEENLQGIAFNFDSKLEPRRNQVVGFHIIDQYEACILNWGMGSGKTKTPIDWVCNRLPSAVLVTCPKAVGSVWRCELEKHATSDYQFCDLTDGKVVDRVESAKEYMKMKKDGCPVFFVVNYESAWRGDLGKWIARQRWPLAIIDEIHRIKGYGSNVSKWFGTALRKKCDKRVGLTGTLMPHSPLDAYGIYRFICPKLFGQSITRFRSRYCVMGGYENREIKSWRRQPEMKQLIASVTHFVKTRDIIELPPVNHIDIRFDLSPKAMKLYKELKNEFIAAVDKGIVTASNALTRLLRLQQLTSGFAVVDADEKTRRIVQVDDSKQNAVQTMVEDLPPTEPVVSFCRFTNDLRFIRTMTGKLDRKYFELSGKENSLEDWQDDASGSMLGVQIQSGSEGVDFTRAHYCAFYSVGFSNGKFDQAIARLDRPGQLWPVIFYHFIANGTVDEYIYNSIQKQRSVISAILDGMGFDPAAPWAQSLISQSPEGAGSL